MIQINPEGSIDKTSVQEKPSKVQLIRRRWIRLLRVIGVTIVPVLFLEGDAGHKPAILNQISRPAEAAPFSATPEDSIQPSPEKSPHTLLREFMKQRERLTEIDPTLIVTLNDPNSKERYEEAIFSWTSDVPIFSALKTREAKERFIGTVLSIDHLNTHPYQTPDLGPDVDGDGVNELTSGDDGVTYNEAGKPIDTTTFVCSNFSQEMALRLGLQNGAPKSDKKLNLPMFKVQSKSGFSHQTQEEQDSNPAYLGHAFNSVYLGTGIEGISDFNNWFFFEPQSDEKVTAPFSHLVNAKYLKLSIPPADLFRPQGDEYLVAFFLFPDGSTHFIGPEKIKILDKITLWVQLNKYPVQVDGKVRDDLMADEPDLSSDSPTDIYAVIKDAVDAGFLTGDEIFQAITDEGTKLPDRFDYGKFYSVLGYLG